MMRGGDGDGDGDCDCDSQTLKSLMLCDALRTLCTYPIPFPLYLIISRHRMCNLTLTLNESFTRHTFPHRGPRSRLKFVSANDCGLESLTAWNGEGGNIANSI